MFLVMSYNFSTINHIFNFAQLICKRHISREYQFSFRESGSFPSIHQLTTVVLSPLFQSGPILRKIFSSQATKYVSERTVRHHVSTHKFTVSRHVEDMYSDSSYNNVILFTVINTSYTCQADVETKMTMRMFLCMTQYGEMCTVGTSA